MKLRRKPRRGEIVISTGHDDNYHWIVLSDNPSECLTYNDRDGWATYGNVSWTYSLDTNHLYLWRPNG